MRKRIKAFMGKEESKHFFKDGKLIHKKRKGITTTFETWNCKCGKKIIHKYKDYDKREELFSKHFDEEGLKAIERLLKQERKRVCKDIIRKIEEKGLNKGKLYEELIWPQAIEIGRKEWKKLKKELKT